MWFSARRKVEMPSPATALPNLTRALNDRKRIVVLTMGSAVVSGARKGGDYYRLVERFLESTFKGLDVVLVQRGVSGELSRDSADRIRQELLAKRAIGEARMRERLERAKREGDLPQTADAAALTRYLSTVLQGMAVQALGGATREDLIEVAELALKAWPST